VELSTLEDRLDIGDVVTRYAFAVDQQDWAAFDQIFADEVHLVVPHVDQEKPVLTRAELVGLIQDTVCGFAATHHLVANQLVTVEGDSATCKAYANAWHTLPTDQGVADYCLVRGYYDWKLARTEAGWRVSEMVITFLHAEGYMGLYDLARANKDTFTEAV
jgi:3-phenylpropionate/cinnamic acid dioxygenase small subunit